MRENFCLSILTCVLRKTYGKSICILPSCLIVVYYRFYVNAQCTLSRDSEKRGLQVHSLRGGRDCVSVRSGIFLSTHRSRKCTQNIIDVCAQRACRVIGCRKLTCERSGNTHAHTHIAFSITSHPRF